jgi:hypothetical protein
MIKLTYRFMGRGKTNHVRLLWKTFPLEEDWHVAYYGSERYVVGVDEEDCLNKVRQQLQLKYYGFRVMKVEEMKS